MTEEQREAAIAAFKKGLKRIFEEMEPLERCELARRIPVDGYVGSVTRRLIG